MIELRAWLDTVQCTAPFTVEDASALRDIIKQAAPGESVEVYNLDGRGKVVRVRIGAFEHDITIV